MPEYLAPGVFVEEVSYRAKSIEGVSTTTTGFIGPTRYGPIDVEPDVITSLVEFERTYGDRQQLAFADQPRPMHNFMWHAVRAFFEQGGKRLYVQRVFRPSSSSDGYAKSPTPLGSIEVRSRFPGAAGKRNVRITLRLGPNVLAVDRDTKKNVLRGIRDFDVVWVADYASPPASPPDEPPAIAGSFYLARAKTSAAGEEWYLEGPLGSGAGSQLPLDSLSVISSPPDWSDQVRVVTATVTVLPSDENSLAQVWDGLALDPRHVSFGARDSLFAKFTAKPENLADARNLPIVIEDVSGTAIDTTGLDALSWLFAGSASLQGALQNLDSNDAQRSLSLLLDHGDDGERPSAAEYEGNPDDIDDKSGLKAFEDIEDISIVAAPGSTFDYENPRYHDDALTIVEHLIAHAEHMQYRIAVLDCGDGQSISAVRAMRGQLDSKYAAFYYPWVKVLDPVTRQEVNLPPSGFVAGIYARNDVNRSVVKAPANEIVTLAIGFETMLNKAQQEVLNPEGINCFRFFEGRGYRLWGARTISSDPEWKYVNLRRYFAYLERSIDRGTQWAVFEPNGPQLWANVRRTISDFLFNEFMNGAFVGDKPETSYFVKCDRSTMTQNDLDNGRLVCLIGVAVVKPAEFVIFRIGQWTADAKQ